MVLLKCFVTPLISEDLWASLSHSSSKPVAAVMDTWTKQMGFPVLSVTAEQVESERALHVHVAPSKRNLEVDFDIPMAEEGPLLQSSQTFFFIFCLCLDFCRGCVEDVLVG